MEFLPINQIQYTRDIDALKKDFLFCNTTEFIQKLQNNIVGNCYCEVIPDNTPVKFYFDVDIKGEYDESIKDYATKTEPRILELVKNCLYANFENPECCILTSSSNSFQDWITQKTYWKISIHIIVQNYLANKQTQRAFIDKLNQYASKNIDYKDYCEKEQNLFDTTIYDANRKLRTYGCSKRGENRPLKLFSGTIEQSLISAYIPKSAIDLTEKFQTTINTENRKTEDNTDEESDNDKEILTQNQELLKIIRIDKKDRITWLRVCSCLKNNGMTNKDWKQFCKNNDLNYDKEKQELFKNIKPYPCLEIYYLKSLAKKSNFTEYKKWVEKWNIYYILPEDIEDPYKSAVVISKTLTAKLKLCKENWFMLTETQLWKQQKEPSFYIINELRKYIDSSNKLIVFRISQTSGEEKEKLIETSKKYLQSYKKISSSGYLNVLTKYLKTLLANDTFVDKLDCNSGKLAFKNGIMDLETKVFKDKIEWCDFITDTIPYDYKPSNFDYIKGVLKKILNNNDDHLEYFLSIIGFSLIGEPNLEKSLYFMIDKTGFGKGDNGKTFFFDILTTLMPNYIYKSKATFLEKTNTKVHKQLVLMKNKRLVWLDEMPKEKNTNAELMKELADGNQIENEIMFGTSETINIMFKLFCLSNHIPKIDPNETAVYNRYKQVSFNSHFDRTGERTKENANELKFIADATLPDTIKENYYNEVFNLVIEYANKYYIRKRKMPSIPQQFINDTKETQSKNDEFGLWFSDNCIINENEVVALKNLVFLSGMSLKEVKDGMERKGFKYERDLSKGLGKDTSGKQYKGGYKGVMLKEDDIIEDDIIEE
jgi:phage/plasmid-associated DNA primase